MASPDLQNELGHALVVVPELCCRCRHPVLHVIQHGRLILQLLGNCMNPSGDELQVLPTHRRRCHTAVLREYPVQQWAYLSHVLGDVLQPVKASGDVVKMTIL